MAERVGREQIYVLAVTTTPMAWRGTTAAFGKVPRIRVALGLHPELVAERHHEVDSLVQLIPEARYVGEIGIDGSPAHRSSLSLQRTILDRILEACASYGGRILSMHSRRAASDVLDALAKHPAAGVAVLHWFSGTRRELDRAIELGCWFSVGPAMLAGAKGRALVGAMPRERVLTETDGPFAKLGDRPLFPWDVAASESTLAEIWGVTLADAGATILSNFRHLISFLPRNRRT